MIFTTWIRRGLNHLHRIYVIISTRHVRRWAGDSGYRRTLLTALTALAATVMPHPALAAALGAAVTEWQPRRHDPYAYEDDDDQFDTDRFEYPNRRLWDGLR